MWVTNVVGRKEVEGIVFVIRLTVKSVERQYSSVLIQMELLWMGGGAVSTVWKGSIISTCTLWE